MILHTISMEKVKRTRGIETHDRLEKGVSTAERMIQDGRE